jgi:prepilin-type N-terminal cleavage/methylation domain-containing protein
MLARRTHQPHFLVMVSFSRRIFRAFTLIELLIVIAIIGVLMALLFPAFQSAINAARKTQAKNDVVQIANAVTSYQMEYGQWPTNATEAATNIGGFFLQALMATTNSNNPRMINFIEVVTYKRGKSGLDKLGNFIDPWAQFYKIEIDTNYDNVLTNVPGAPTSLRKTVAVWSIGIPKSGSDTSSVGYTANTNTNTFIKSWE